MSPNMIEVRAFLAGVAGHAVAPGRIPQTLRQLVRGAARGRFDCNDLLQDLLADLLERTRKHQTGGIAELLELDDGQLLAALRRRVLQVSATAGGDRWKTVKLLRERVRAVLQNPLPVVDAPPTGIIRAGRVDTTKVAEAVAWHRAQPGNMADGAKEIASWLLTTYLSDPIAYDLHPTASASDYECVDDRLDGVGVARELPNLLGPELMEIVVRRASGETLRDIAARLGCATSTAYARLREAARGLSEVATHSGWSRRAFEDEMRLTR